LTKAVPVRPRLLGGPAPGFEVESFESEPAEISVTGPRSRVQEIESAFTEPVSVAGADATVEQYVNVGLEDPLLRPEGGNQVRVVVRIRERHERASFDGLPVIVRGQPAALSPPEIRVEVSGPERVLRDLAPADLRPYVIVPPEHDGTKPLPVAVEVASGHTGTSVVRTEPAEVMARPLSTRRRP
jgi:YbbR domain-containing protein